MHSPPRQPSSSIKSGTGSVMTMWLEVAVRARRSGRKRSRELPAASTQDFARTVPMSAAMTTSPPFSVTERTAERSWMTTPASSSRRRRPSASLAGCTVAPCG